jgi:hypothetical protein
MMMKLFLRFNAARVAALGLIAMVVAAGACRSATEPHDHEPDVHAVRLNFNNGAQIVTIVEGQVGASVSLAPGTSASVSAQWLDDDDHVIDDITGDEFELRILGLGLSFTRTGPFAGTISGLVSGSTVVTVQLWHLVEAHDDFEVQLTIDVP